MRDSVIALNRRLLPAKRQYGHTKVSVEMERCAKLSEKRARKAEKPCRQHSCATRIEP